MPWKCPACKFADNVDSTIRCSCGYEQVIREDIDYDKKSYTGQMTKGSLFKLLLIGISVSYLPFFLLCGIASIFGASTIRWEGEQVTGFMGFISALIMYPFFCLLLVFFSWLSLVFGLWLYSKFRKLEFTFTNCETK